MNTYGDEYITRLILDNTDTGWPISDKVNNLKKIREFVQKRLSVAYERNRKQYNLRRRYVNYNVGDLLWKRQFVLSDAANYFASKLSGKFCGPFKIR